MDCVCIDRKFSTPKNGRKKEICRKYGHAHLIKEANYWHNSYNIQSKPRHSCFSKQR